MSLLWRTRLIYNLIVSKSWMCQHASQALQKGQWGEKLCTLQFPLPMLNPCFDPSSFSRTTKDKEGVFNVGKWKLSTLQSHWEELKAVSLIMRGFSNFSWQVARADTFQRKCFWSWFYLVFGRDIVEVGIRRELTAPLLHCNSHTAVADGLAGRQREP